MRKAYAILYHTDASASVYRRWQLGKGWGGGGGRNLMNTMLHGFDIESTHVLITSLSMKQVTVILLFSSSNAFVEIKWAAVIFLWWSFPPIRMNSHDRTIRVQWSYLRTSVLTPVQMFCQNDVQLGRKSLCVVKLSLILSALVICLCCPMSIFHLVCVPALLVCLCSSMSIFHLICVPRQRIIIGLIITLNILLTLHAKCNHDVYP